MTLFKSILIILSLSCVIFACNEGDELNPHQDCISEFLERFEMKDYNGGTIACGENYLVLFENETYIFAVLHNDCADLPPQLILDCNAIELCTYVTEEGCFEMVLGSENLGIIGIE